MANVKIIFIFLAMNGALLLLPDSFLMPLRMAPAGHSDPCVHICLYRGFMVILEFKRQMSRMRVSGDFRVTTPQKAQRIAQPGFTKYENIGKYPCMC
jgi:hypothetical protein